MSLRPPRRSSLRGAGLLPAVLALSAGGLLVPRAGGEPAPPLLAPGLSAEERTVAERVLASTVALAVTAAGERPAETGGSATGFLVREDGLVATSWRLLAGVGREKRLWAKPPGGAWGIAVPLGATWWCDVGLVRLVGARAAAPPLAFAEATREQMGQRFLAVGAPVGPARLAAATELGAVQWFDPEAPGGLTEATRKRPERPGKRAATIALCMGEEAWTPSALGAPLVDAAGRCVGLVTASDPTRTATDRVIVRPASLLRLAIDPIARESTFDPAELGVRFSPSPAPEGATPPEVPAELAAVRAKVSGGALVTLVEPDGPANGRLWEGDVVLAIEGRPIVAEIPASFGLALLPVVPGAQVEVTVFRGGRPQALRVGTARARHVYADYTAEHDGRGAALRRR